LASVGHFVACQRNNIISCFLLSFTHHVLFVYIFSAEYTIGMA